MPPRPDLPRGLRRAADTPATGTRRDPRLEAAASDGRLTRGNTQPGTRGRQAVYRAELRHRVAAGRRKYPDQTARELAGHDRPEVRRGRAISVMLERPSPFTIIDQPTPGEAARIGRYDALMRRLAAGRIHPESFRRRVEGLAPIRGERFLADPAAVLAGLEERRAAGEPLFIYVSGRAA